MRKHSIDEIRFEFDKRGYTLLSNEYYNNATHMEYICRKHPSKGVMKITYGNFQSGRGCPYCGGEKSWRGRQRVNIRDIREAFAKRGYTLLDDKYINAHTKLHYRCKKHPDKDLFISWNNFKNGRGCKYCAIDERAKNKRVPKHIIVQKCEELEYQYVDSYYVDSVLYVQYICKKHEQYGVQKISWSNLRAGQRCRYCQNSKGEEMICNVLKQHGVDFYTQWSFDDCRYCLPLKFDFWLPSYNCIIEYDGEQHFQPVQFGGISVEQAKERLHDTQIRDNIKNQYCQHHNIDLIRIPHWEKDNIEKILCDKLNIC